MKKKLGRLFGRGRRGDESAAPADAAPGPVSRPVSTAASVDAGEASRTTSVADPAFPRASADSGDASHTVPVADPEFSSLPADPADVAVKKVSLPPAPAFESAAAASVARAEVSAAELAARLADPGTSFADRPYVSVAERAAPAAPERPPHVVEFRNVTKTYGTHTAIKDVSFVVEDLPGAGEFVAILGPSGCGKSTILRLIAGLSPQHPATSGDVFVGGRPVQGPGADRGMVFQDYTSFDSRSVLDNIAFGLECRGVPRAEREAQAREWIEKVGLHVDRDQHKYPHQLSGGMKQRVAIARTLILNPRIILMDEPFGALDPATRLNMQDLLMGLWREASATVFFITHSVEEAVYLGDRVYIMSPAPGTILEERTIPKPGFPAREMQRHPDFLEMAFEIRDVVERLESSTKGGT